MYTNLRTLSLRFTTRTVVRQQACYLPIQRHQMLVASVPRLHYTSRSLPLFQEDKNNNQEEPADIAEPEEELVDAEPEPGHKDKLIQQLEKQLEEFTQNWRAAQHEAENVKKIMTRDLARAREAGIDKLAKKLFPMSDTLDICIKNKPDFESDAHKNNEHAKRAFEGIESAKNQLVSILKGMGVEEVVPKEGEPFDVAYHEALFPVENKSLPPGSIGMILKVGWKRDNVLLRAACVGVVNK